LEFPDVGAIIDRPRGDAQHCRKNREADSLPYGTYSAAPPQVRPVADARITPGL